MRRVNSIFSRIIFAILINGLLALLVTLAATGILILFRETITQYIIVLLYLLPVGLSTTLWGLSAGILSAVAAFLGFNYYFIQPYFSFRVRHTQDLIGLLVFLGVAVVISQLLGRARSNLAEATAREKEAIRLYELSVVLAGLNDSQQIARTIAQHALETFQANRVDVVLEPNQDQKPYLVHLTAPLSLPPKKEPDPLAELLIPLQTTRSMLGEIHIWRRQQFSQADERLARTFASQGVLSLERARLGATETRARVLDESDRLKTALLSSVSHELRTPLATIKAAVTSLLSGVVEWDTPARTELLMAIEEETDQLNQLVGNLLNMSRIEAGALQPNFEWNALNEIVSSVVSKIRRIDRERHAFILDLPEDLPLIRVDYTLIGQVLINLISNSIKYSPPGSPIKISAREIPTGQIQVQVINQGPAVPREHIERIFDKFHRITASDRVTGTGLGLSICKGIIEAHHGQIWAENLGDGVSFIFTVPLTQKGEQPRPPQEITSEVTEDRI